MPRLFSAWPSIRRRHFLIVGLAALGGCTSPLFFRGQSPESEDLPYEEDEQAVRYVGQMTGVWGMNYAKVEGIALVTRLDGTGSDPPPTAQRERLISEMETHEVEYPSKVLASPDTSMVLVVGYLPPGVKKGDNFDVDVRVPSRSQTSSLRNGYLMQSRLRPMEVLGNGIKTGQVLALAKGSLLVDAVFAKEGDSVLETRANVLGGGVALNSRPLGLVVRNDAFAILTTSMIGTALNRRFSTVERGGKRGVATPKDDKIIELAVPGQYKHNITRYMRVVASVVVQESQLERVDRMQLLERQLLEPATASTAALRLEAIGDEAVKVLEIGLRSEDPEVRFYSAEALAYLEKPEAAKALGEAARKEPAFRWHALSALASMQDIEAGIALSELLHVPSNETRYGAFRALQARTANDPLVRGDVLNDGTYFHVVATNSEPMVHFARRRHQEIVLFGHDQELSPKFLYVAKGWTIRGEDTDHIKVSRFAVEDGERHEVCSARLHDVLRAVDKLGGTYADLLDIVHKAKDANALEGRFVIEALPRSGRVYRRDEGEPADEGTVRTVSGPVPNLFGGAQSSDESSDDQPADRYDIVPDEPKRSFFGRMTGWFSGSST